MSSQTPIGNPPPLFRFPNGGFPFFDRLTPRPIRAGVCGLGRFTTGTPHTRAPRPLLQPRSCVRELPAAAAATRRHGGGVAGQRRGRAAAAVVLVLVRFTTVLSPVLEQQNKDDNDDREEEAVPMEHIAAAAVAMAHGFHQPFRQWCAAWRRGGGRASSLLTSICAGCRFGSCVIGILGKR